MISPETKIAVLKAVGGKYIQKIAQFAESEGVKKNNGKPYSISMIRKVLNGERENEVLENLILKCADYYLAEREAQLAREEFILKKSKTA